MNALYVNSNGYGITRIKPQMYVNKECFDKLMKSKEFRRAFLAANNANILFVSSIGSKTGKDTSSFTCVGLNKLEIENNRDEGWGYVGKLSAIS